MIYTINIAEKRWRKKWWKMNIKSCNYKINKKKKDWEMKIKS